MDTFYAFLRNVASHAGHPAVTIWDYIQCMSYLCVKYSAIKSQLPTGTPNLGVYNIYIYLREDFSILEKLGHLSIWHDVCRAAARKKVKRRLPLDASLVCLNTPPTLRREGGVCLFHGLLDGIMLTLCTWIVLIFSGQY